MSFDETFTPQELHAKYEETNHKLTGLCSELDIYWSYRTKSFFGAIGFFVLEAILWIVAFKYVGSTNTSFWLFVFCVMLSGCVVLSNVFSIAMHCKVKMTNKACQKVYSELLCIECDIMSHEISKD